MKGGVAGYSTKISLVVEFPCLNVYFSEATLKCYFVAPLCYVYDTKESGVHT